MARMAYPKAILYSLAVYFFINLCLSTFNKLVLEKIPTPWLLTCFHCTITYFGCSAYLKRQSLPEQALSSREYLTLLGFSFLFTANIAMSNISLSHVSLAFHQLARSTSPIFTVFVYGVWFRKLYPVPVYVSVAATSIGIGLATYGDYTCSIIGFWLTFSGTVLATVKTIATNRLLTGTLNFDPTQALLHMCPFAAVQSFICACISGEVEIILSQGPIPNSTMVLVLINGFLAYWQNLSSFRTNKMAGALTLAVAANLKQACTIVLAINIFETQVSLSSALGIAIVLSSTWYYSWTTFRQRPKDEEKGDIVESQSGSASWEEENAKQ